MKPAVLLFLVALAAAAPAFAAMRASTDEFIQKTAAGNKFEIDTSNLALDKANSAEIKNFARQMIADHTKAGEDFKAALAKAGKSTPPPDATPDADHRKVLDDLQAATGDDFDVKYAAAQVAAHDETVALFQNYIKNGDQKDLKSFAENTLPVLLRHQEMAKSLKEGR